MCVHQVEDISNKGWIREDVRKLVERLKPNKLLFDRLKPIGVLSVKDHKTLIEENQDRENLLKILTRNINTRRTFNSFLAVVIEFDTTGMTYILNLFPNTKYKDLGMRTGHVFFHFCAKFLFCEYTKMTCTTIHRSIDDVVFCPDIVAWIQNGWKFNSHSLDLLTRWWHLVLQMWSINKGGDLGGLRGQSTQNERWRNWV